MVRSPLDNIMKDHSSLCRDLKWLYRPGILQMHFLNQSEALCIPNFYTSKSEPIRFFCSATHALSYTSSTIYVLYFMFDFDRKVKTTGNYFVSIHPSQMFRYFNPMESTCQEHRSNKRERENVCILLCNF